MCAIIYSHISYAISCREIQVVNEHLKPTVCCEDCRDVSLCVQIIAHKKHEIMFTMITAIFSSYRTKVALQIYFS